MNADIRVSNAALNPDLGTGRRGERELRVGGVHLRRCGTHECVGKGVLSWIAALQVRGPVIGGRW